jgi:C-terminal processing protease CtpA/Prc
VSLAEKSGLKVGDVIEAVNDRKVSSIVKERVSLTPASNYPTKLRDIAKFLLQTNDNALKIRFERENKINEIRTEAYPINKLKNKPDEIFSRDAQAFKLITPDIAYLYIGSLKRGEIGTLIPTIAKTKGLIIDMRTYPSDFIVFSFGKFLMPKATEFVKFSMGSLSTPGLFTAGEPLKVGETNDSHYKGKVVILVNEITQSSAEYTAMALRTAPGALVIGSTTAGADGNVSTFLLPGGIMTRMSGIGICYPDGRETQRIGIVPDIVFHPTIKGIREGKDEMLEKAIDVLGIK